MAEAKQKGPDVAKLLKLVEVARDLHGKLGAVLDEFDELLGGGAGIAAQMKEFEQAFDALWCERYARGQFGRYMWRYAMDRPNLKRLIKALGLEDLKGRAARYIATEDDFLKRQRHPFGLFVSGINSYAGEGETPALELDAEAPADCRHTPRCRTDAEHTRKRTAEMRS